MFCVLHFLFVLFLIALFIGAIIFCIPVVMKGFEIWTDKIETYFDNMKK